MTVVYTGLKYHEMWLQNYSAWPRSHSSHPFIIIDALFSKYVLNQRELLMRGFRAVTDFVAVELMFPQMVLLFALLF